MILTAKVKVKVKTEISDPQGLTIKNSLNRLGFDEVEKVQFGKYLEIKLEATSIKEAEKKVDLMCKKLLVNEVVEEYSFEVS